MSFSDPIGDLLTRIRNGQMRRHAVVSSPSSKLRVSVLGVLQDEGYIRGFRVVEEAGEFPKVEVELKYFDGEPVISEIARVSKPGRRIYSAVKDLPLIRNGLGISIVSTPKGVMSDAQARENNVGGEVLARVY